MLILKGLACAEIVQVSGRFRQSSLRKLARVMPDRRGRKRKSGSRAAAIQSFTCQVLYAWRKKGQGKKLGRTMCRSARAKGERAGLIGDKALGGARGRDNMKETEGTSDEPIATICFGLAHAVGTTGEA